MSKGNRKTANTFRIKQLFSLSNVAYLLVVIGVTFAILYTIIGEYLNTSWSIDDEKASRYGSFIGGFLGTVFSLVGVLLLLENLKRQRAEYDRQLFESSFFSMLNILREIVNNTKGKIKVLNGEENHFFTALAKQNFDNFDKEEYYQGEEFFSKLMQYLKNLQYYNVYRDQTDLGLLLSEANQKLGYDNTEDIKDQFFIQYVHFYEPDIDIYLPENSDKKVEYWTKFPISMYYYMYRDYYIQLGHYLRYLFNIMKFILESRSKYKDEKKYINLVQAQLSSDQLGLIFYNVLSVHGRNSEGKPLFYEWLEEYRFFQKIDSDSLIYQDDYLFYPNTDFKYRTLRKSDIQKNN